MDEKLSVGDWFWVGAVYVLIVPTMLVYQGLYWAWEFGAHVHRTRSEKKGKSK
jgi:hypothetical protein